MRTTASKLLDVLRGELITVQHVQIEDKDTDEIRTEPTDQFMHDLECFNRAGIFADTMDVTYEMKGASGLKDRIGYMNQYSQKAIKVELEIPEGTDLAILKSKLKIE